MIIIHLLGEPNILSISVIISIIRAIRGLPFFFSGLWHGIRMGLRLFSRPWRFQPRIPEGMRRRNLQEATQPSGENPPEPAYSVFAMDLPEQR